MTGNSHVVWLCVVGAMLLQVTYMILPFQRWDWARYLASAAIPALTIARSDQEHRLLSAHDGVDLCVLFILVFAFIFRERLLPRLAESTVLTWTAVLLWTTAELLNRDSAATFAIGAAALLALTVVIRPMALPYLAKLALHVWYLFAVVTIGVLQFRWADYRLLMGGGAAEIDYRFALIDGMVAGYIGVHAALLYQLLPIPGRGEAWAEFRARWRDYLDDAVERVDDQQLPPLSASCLVLCIFLLASANHWLRLMPVLTLAGLILVVVPFISHALLPRRELMAGHDESRPGKPRAPVTTPADAPRGGIGRMRHSRKHGGQPRDETK